MEGITTEPLGLLRRSGRAVRSSRIARGAGPTRAAIRVAALALAALLVFAAPAAGHTELQWSRPADGETLVGPPAELRLRFTTPVEVRYTQVVLIGPDGSEVATPPLESSEGRREFHLTFAAPLPPGGYTVRWRTAGADGHVIQGEFGFTVEPDPNAAPPVAPAPPPGDAPATAASAPPALSFPTWAESGSPLSAGVRFLHFVTLLLLIGATAFRFGVLRGLPADSRSTAVAEAAAAGARALATAAVACLGLVIVARLWLQSVALNGVEQAWDPSALRLLLTGTVWGRAWLLQLAAAALLVIGLMLLFRRPGGRTGWRTIGSGVLGLAVVPALSGHAVALERVAWIAVANDALHVLAAGTWLGSLAMLLFAGLPAALRFGGGERMGTVAALVNRFSRVALAAAGVVVLTGVINAVFHFDAPAQLWTTAYGRTLLLKVGVLLPVVGLGAYNWRVVRPALGGAASTGHLRRSAGAEIAIGVLVLLVTAVLVAVPRP